MLFIDVTSHVDRAAARELSINVNVGNVYLDLHVVVTRVYLVRVHVACSVGGASLDLLDLRSFM